jgi:hypothetical protein
MGRPREDNAEMDMRKTGSEDVDWIELDQDRVQCKAVMRTVMNLWVL